MRSWTASAGRLRWGLARPWPDQRLPGLEAAGLAGAAWATINDPWDSGVTTVAIHSAHATTVAISMPARRVNQVELIRQSGAAVKGAEA
jgi:hypothetical protein